ncbi:hypothetical protein [Laceyella sacchari]|uniref:Uncharacterized protein n=1 Tax=Laceyella sacchari TaxID=37482 RepID=A0ABY5TZG1_LACSH|nr:hypothetical protein [Laceyella sacchari]TCW37645.1 hypothetical protein EDC32_103305 [Laceyella sacchari]UWE02796.1 hypothetical protein NYR52_11715 [Laceyella sacchari]
MSKLQRFFSGVVETSDDAKENALRTRYYRDRLSNAVAALKQIPAQASRFRLIHVDSTRGEVMLEYANGLGLKHDLVVTVIEVSPMRLAVDVHAALRARFVDMGWNVQAISIIYAMLDRQLAKDERLH